MCGLGLGVVRGLHVMQLKGSEACALDHPVILQMIKILHIHLTGIVGGWAGADGLLGICM